MDRFNRWILNLSVEFLKVQKFLFRYFYYLPVTFFMNFKADDCDVHQACLLPYSLKGFSSTATS